MAHDYRPESSQWNMDEEYQLSEDAKEFGAHKRMAEQPKLDLTLADENQREVFISYSSAEYGVALRMRGILQNNGISCWMAPEDIPGGSNYTKEIPTAIRGCKIFVLMLSERAQQSHWVLKELNAAVNEGKLILPFMLENCGLIDEFNFLLSGAQWFPAFQYPEEAMEKLTERVKAVLREETVPAATAVPHTTAKLPQIPMVEHQIKPVTDSAVQTPEKKEELPETGKKAGRKKKKRGDRELVCPACGSAVLSPTKKKGYTKAEQMRRNLHTFGCIALPLLSVILVWSVLVFAAAFDVDLAGVISAIVAIVVLILMLTKGRKQVRDKIRRHRIRKHIRVSGVCCDACDKRFVLTIGEEEKFPWEK